MRLPEDEFIAVVARTPLESIDPARRLPPVHRYEPA